MKISMQMTKKCLIMFKTQTSSFSGIFAKGNQTILYFLWMPTSSFRRNLYNSPINKYLFNFRMAMVYMFRLIIKKFKIFWSIIISNTILMMNFFITSQKPSNQSFHYVSMFKNSFLIPSNSFISQIIKTTIFQMCKIWAVIKRFMSVPSFVVHRTSCDNLIGSFSSTNRCDTKHRQYYPTMEYGGQY